MRGQMTHLEADVLADFRAGLITGRRGGKISAHLAGCDRCTALGHQLAGVTTLLASVPAPVMPDSVAQRLDTVLAAEAASRRDSPERAGREPSRDTGASPRRAAHRGFRRPSLRVLVPVAAAAAVILAGGGYGLSLLAHGPGSQATASAAGGTASRAAKSVASSANRGAPLQSGRAGASARSPLLPAASVTVVTSGTDFQAATFEEQLTGVLRVPPAADSEQAASARVQGCVQRVAGGASLVRVLSARYDGQPATIIVARTGTHDTAWVAGSGCSSTNRDVLRTTSLPQGI